jgi:putative transposase
VVHILLDKKIGKPNCEVARGLKLRSDHGSQFLSEHYRKQLSYFGIHHSLGVVKEPETNEVIERFHRTLKEQVIRGYSYRNLEELRPALATFIERYNEEWLLVEGSGHFAVSAIWNI